MVRSLISFLCSVLLVSAQTSAELEKRCDQFAERTDGEIAYDPDEWLGLRLGAVATLQCYNGNLRRVRCTASGWKPSSFLPCELLAKDVPNNGDLEPPQGCPSLTNTTNGFVVYSPLSLPPFRPDTEATLVCYLGFVPSGGLVTRCGTDGTWTGLGGCVAPSDQHCPQLNGAPNAQVNYVNGPNGPFGVGAIAEFSCNTGYSMEGSGRVTCSDSGWDPAPGNCVEATTGSCFPLTVFNGQVSYLQANAFSLYQAGTTAILTCNTGFTAAGATSSYCTGTTWSPTLGQCQSLGAGLGAGLGTTGLTSSGIMGLTPSGQCGAGLATPLNGQVIYSTGGTFGPFSAGTVATLVCNLGFTLQGMAMATCVNGAWTPLSLGACSSGAGLGTGGVMATGGVAGAAACTALSTPSNAQLQYSQSQGLGSYAEGTSATIVCNAGTVVSGSATSYCRSGQWYPPLGQCVSQNSLANNINGLGTTASVCSLAMAVPLNAQVQYSTGLSVGPFPQGTTAMMSCTLGTPIGPTSSTCSYGQWLPPLFSGCQLAGGTGWSGASAAASGGAYCAAAPGLASGAGGTLTYGQGSQHAPFPAGTTATLGCAPGQQLGGPGAAACHAGAWTPPLLGPCQPASGWLGATAGGGTGTQCLVGLLAPLNGRVTYSQAGAVGPFPAGTSATLQCDVGYAALGPSVAYCQAGLFQPAQLGTCVPAGGQATGLAGGGAAGLATGLAGGLGDGANALNGVYGSTMNNFGQGLAMGSATQSGISSCYRLPTATNGIITYTSLPNLQGTYPIGTTASLSCNLGTQALGSVTSTCLSNGWSSFSLGSCVSQFGK